MKFLMVLLFFIINNSYSCLPIGEGEVEYGERSFIKFVGGSMPLIISVPHDGHLEPSDIPIRKYGTFDRDIRTHDFSLSLYNSIKQITGKAPYLIISRLHRNRLDLNRDIVEGAQGNKDAIKHYNEYHGFIERAKCLIGKKGLFIDFHGHAHEKQRLEIGYMLSGSELNKSDYELNYFNYEGSSSIRNLVARSKFNFANILRGDSSMGYFMEDNLVSAIPSDMNPSPNGDPYFNGGYNTKLYGSIESGEFNSMQFETPWDHRKSLTDRRNFADSYAYAIHSFMIKHSVFSE